MVVGLKWKPIDKGKEPAGQFPVWIQGRRDSAVVWVPAKGSKGLFVEGGDGAFEGVFSFGIFR